MRVEQLPSVGEVVSTLEAQRQRLSDADLVGASRSALTSARDALPDGWPRRRRASRWPWVAVVILGATILGLVLMAPALRRWAASVWASGRRRAEIPRGGPPQQQTAAHAKREAERCDDAHVRQLVDVILGIGEPRI